MIDKADEPKPERIFAAAAILIAGLICFLWLRSDDMRRPLGIDEAISLKYYTWVGTDEEGIARRLPRMSDLKDFPKPGLRQLLIGVYCALGRSAEPNNHIVNSALMNATLAFGPRDEVGARLPALIGGFALAALLTLACGRILGSYRVAPFAVVWALLSPFMLAYGREARGYSWMVAIQVLSLLIAERFVRKPNSLVIGVAAAAVGAITAMNIPTLAADWIFPLYLVLFLWPTDGLDGDRRVGRTNLIAQMLAIGGVGFVFLMDRLPQVYSWSRQYGVPANGLNDRINYLFEIVRYLFPTIPWKILGAAGVIGLALPTRKGSWFLARLGLTVLVIAVAHHFLSRMMLYQRMYGYLLPLFVLGAANLVQRVFDRLPSAKARMIAFGATVAASVPLAFVTIPLELKADDVKTLVDGVGTSDKPQYVLVTPDPGTISFMLYVPPGWSEFVSGPPPAGPADVLVMQQGDKVATRPGEKLNWETGPWSVKSATSGNRKLVRMTGRFAPLAEAKTETGRALIVWYPSPESIGDSHAPAVGGLEKAGIRHLVQMVRTQVKLLLSARMGDTVVIAESPDEFKAATKAVEEGMKRCGGTAVVFIPDAPATPAR